jgi:hypothetical protein
MGSDSFYARISHQKAREVPRWLERIQRRNGSIKSEIFIGPIKYRVNEIFSHGIMNDDEFGIVRTDGYTKRDPRLLPGISGLLLRLILRDCG